MLKFILVLVFLMPVCVFSNISWFLVQLMFFVFSFVFMMEVVTIDCVSGIVYAFGFDLLSYGMIMLSFWIMGLMVVASSHVFRYGYYCSLFLFILIFLMVMLLCAFGSLNYVSFYIFFEGSLVPTLLLILGWGYQPERIQAGVYLLFYTLIASLPLLLSLLWLSGVSFTLFMYGDMGLEGDNFCLYICMILAFLVSMPMFLFHLWLPKAHVEAPVSGSMILAGVLLKLGGYGLLRIFSVLVGSCVNYGYWWISISLVGGVMVSLVCLRQVDMKALVAYSSVAHMGIALSGLMSMNVGGFCGSYLMMIGHGLCSSGLFCLVNISYERLGSRSLMVNSGLMHLMPSLCLWWFLLSSSNMAAPPSLNLLAEISLINSILSWSLSGVLMIMLISFFSAAYSLYLFSYSQHGSYYSGYYSSMSGVFREYHLLVMHWVPLNVLVLSGGIFFSWLF